MRTRGGDRRRTGWLRSLSKITRRRTHALGGTYGRTQGRGWRAIQRGRVKSIGEFSWNRSEDLPNEPARCRSHVWI